jgi:HAD superfamily hydrolase (TIGR01484 family)
MKYLALATDYDGTLATDGQVDTATLEALQRWKATGRQLILITGRRLDDFLHVFAHMDLFDLAVVENGPVLYSPADRTETLLGEAPPAEFVAQLRDCVLHQTSTS